MLETPKGVRKFRETSRVFIARSPSFALGKQTATRLETGT
jgi:hypothetical protein